MGFQSLEIFSSPVQPSLRMFQNGGYNFFSQINVFFIGRVGSLQKDGSHRMSEECLETLPGSRLLEGFLLKTASCDSFDWFADSRVAPVRVWRPFHRFDPPRSPPSHDTLPGPHPPPDPRRIAPPLVRFSSPSTLLPIHPRYRHYGAL